MEGGRYRGIAHGQGDDLPQRPGTKGKEEGKCTMRERGTGRIFQRGSTWWIQFYARGQQIRMSAETDDPKKAAKLLRKKIGQVEAGVHKDTRRITYEQLRASYYEDYSVKKRRSLRLDREGHPRLDKVIRLDSFFEGYRISDIDADLIRKFIADQQAKGLSDGSTNRSISALRRMFNLAQEDGKIQVNDIPHFPTVAEAPPRQGFFEREDYDKLFAVLPDYLKLLVAIGYYSGMRLGEILALEWSKVDFLHGVIHLLKTKNGHPRDLPIVSQLRTLLMDQHAKSQPGCAHVCFRFNRKGHAVKIQGFRKAWYSSCIKAELGKMVPAKDRVTGELLYAPPRGPRSKPKVKGEYEGMIFHDLRRTGVRNLVRAGVPQSVAMKCSGHETASVFKRYDITSGEDFAEAGRKLELFHSQKVGDISGTACTDMQQPDSPIN